MKRVYDRKLQVKIDYMADVESFKAQLAKPIPEKSIVEKDLGKTIRTF